MYMQQAAALASRLRRISNNPNAISLHYCPNTVAEIREQVVEVAKGSEAEEPRVAVMLLSLKDKLFVFNKIGQAFINPYVLGEIVFGLDYLAKGPQTRDNKSEWAYIHPQIQEVSRKLFLDGHFANAAEDAFIELNAKVKEMYQELVPDAVGIPDGCELMHKIFNAKFPICELRDTNYDSGYSFQLGFQHLCAGAMSAFRNPKAHSNNETITAEEAMRRLMFASSLMYELDRALDNMPRIKVDEAR